MSDSEGECDFQAPVSLPIDIYTRKRNRTNNEDMNYEETEEDLVEATECNLCDSFWSNNGVHGIVSLKCGHVFGKNCIEQHIRDSIAKDSTAKCPTCLNTLTKGEPRRIWPNKVVPCDEIDLIPLRKEHAEADRIIQELKKSNEAIMQQIDQAKFDLAVLQSEDRSNKLITPIQTIQLSQPSMFVHQRTFSMTNEKYRVMNLDPMEDRVVLSVWKNMHQQYGLRKINLYDPTQTEFISNHSGIIKDLKHTTNNLILSTGLDKTLKLTSLLSNQVVLSYELGVPGWSCATDNTNPSIVYCGLTNNTVLIFDIRNTKEFVRKLIEPCVPGIFSPIHSMDVFTNDSASSMLICSNLTHNYGWSTSKEEYEYVPLEQSTDCSSGTTDKFKSFAMVYSNDYMLSSLRNKTSTRYEVSHFNTSLELQLDWHYDDLNHKQNLLSRNIHFTRDEQVYICFSDNDTVKIRNQAEEVQKIKVNGPVADIKYIEDEQVLTILTEDELCMYKFAPPEYPII